MNIPNPWRPHLKRFLIPVLILTAVNAAAAVRGRVVRTPQEKPNGWTAPNCTTTFGLPGFYFTRDEGRTVSINPQPLPVNTGLNVVATDVPNRMFAMLGEDLYDSADAGCSWSMRSRGPMRPTSMVAAPGGRAYAWSYGSPDKRLLRISGSSFDSVKLPDMPLAVGVDPADAQHLVAVTRTRVYESHNAGSNWSDRGAVPAPLLNHAAIDPRDVRHIVVGRTGGASVSLDGGMTWQNGNTQGANVWSVAFSPADPKVVWMQGLVPSGRETVYRSIDGGITYSPVLAASSTSAGIHFNRELVVPNPNDPDTVAFGAWEGLAIVAASGAARLGPGYQWDSVTWSPAPGVIYLTVSQVFLTKKGASRDAPSVNSQLSTANR